MAKFKPFWTIMAMFLMIFKVVNSQTCYSSDNIPRQDDAW